VSRRPFTLSRTDGHRRRRLDRLVAAGLIDSFGLALGWTVFLLHAVAAHGLGTAAAYSAAMLVGIALSAPFAGLVAARLDGRRLLRSTAVAEAALRGGVFALLLLGLPVPVLAVLVVVTNVVAWTGYAGMRAEIAAESEGRRRTRALTWYAGGIAAIEAAGAAVAALLPVGPEGTVTGPLLAVVVAVYVIVLLPTFLVGRSSRVGISVRARGHFPLLRCVPMFTGAFAVMLLASGPAFLFVALTAELHGRMWVAPAAVAFTAGALIAPVVVAALERRRFPAPALWPLLGVGMIGGWSVAGWSVGGLLFAQFLSGVFMTSLEGTIDARVAETVPEQVTAGMAWAGAVRALGSAAAVALAPTAIALGGLGAASGFSGVVLASVACVGLLGLVGGARKAAMVSPRMPG
jgi:hypothetical protein